MRRTRGFKIGRRLVRIPSLIFRMTLGFDRLCSSGPTCRLKPFAKLIKWGRSMTARAKSLCSANPGSGYVRISEEPVHKKALAVPKGHLAVYVGQKDGDYHRVLVPVIYFNHPLFGELLRGAENEYGFSQQGGITIPCQYSEFERVQTRIEAGSGGRKLTWKRRHYC